MILLMSIFLAIAAQAQPEASQAQPDTAPPLQEATISAKATTVSSESKNVSVFEEEEGTLVKKLTQPFIYSSTGKRDPFRLPEINAAQIPITTYFGPFLETQEIPLEKIKLKAILFDPVKPKAFIEYSNFKKQTVFKKVMVGEYLGENFGVIQSIRPGEVIVVQTFVEGDQKSTTTKTLSIRK